MHIEIMAIFFVIVCMVGIWWGYPKIPAPWNLIVVLFVVALCVLGLFMVFSGKTITFG